MIGETILHYPPAADQPMADKILEKLGEVRLVPIHIYAKGELKL